MCTHNRLERVTRNNGIQSTGIEGYDLVLYNCLDCNTTLAPLVRIHGEEMPMPENFDQIVNAAWAKKRLNNA